MRLKHWSHQDFLEHEFPKEPLLVKPTVPTKSILLIHAKRGLGKSHVAWSLAIAIAGGERWLEEYDCRQEPVLFFEADMSGQLQQTRILPSSDLTRDLPIDHIFSTPGDSRKLGRGHPAFKELREEPGVVFIDTLRNIHVLKENESESTQLVYMHWREMFPDATLIFLHHDRKPPPGLRVFAEDPGDDARGSAWLDSADTGIYLRRPKAKKGETRWTTSMGWSKCRLMALAELPTHLITLDDETLLATLAEPSAAQQLAIHLKRYPDMDRRSQVHFLLALTNGNGKHLIGSEKTAYRIARSLEKTT